MKHSDFIENSLFKFPHISHRDLFFHHPQNIIIFSPPGSNKLTLALSIILPFSPSHLKYEKFIHLNNDKVFISFKMSDAHFEIDLQSLSSFSKTIWNDIFLLIIDIVFVKPSKFSIILFKNFSNIHNDLIDSFYTYIQHYNLSLTNKENVLIKFIILTDHISFIPQNILQISTILPIPKPDLDTYNQMMTFTTPSLFHSFHKPHHSSHTQIPKPTALLTHDVKNINNFNLLHLPPDFFIDHLKLVSDSIIHSIIHYQDIVMTKFRDTLYEILTYNLDVYECVWYVLCHFIERPSPPRILKTQINNILLKTQLFFKYYNNNYRPIYHLENIFYYIIQQLHRLDT